MVWCGCPFLATRKPGLDIDAGLGPPSMGLSMSIGWLGRHLVDQQVTIQCRPGFCAYPLVG